MPVSVTQCNERERLQKYLQGNKRCGYYTGYYNCHLCCDLWWPRRVIRQPPLKYRFPRTRAASKSRAAMLNAARLFRHQTYCQRKTRFPCSYGLGEHTLNRPGLLVRYLQCQTGKNNNNNLTRNYPIAHPSRLDH